MIDYEEWKELCREMYRLLTGLHDNYWWLENAPNDGDWTQCVLCQEKILRPYVEGYGGAPNNCEEVVEHARRHLKLAAFL